MMPSLLASLLIIILVYLVFFHFHIHLYTWYMGFPKPKNQVILEKDIKIKMKDGVQLATDIYRPKGFAKYPVIMIRTPYNKQGNVHPYKKIAEVFASQGYVFIVQDVRGKYSSEGTFSPYTSEGEDGHTSINWAGKATWSNGKVALFGFSYLGSCAWLAAVLKSPYLSTVIPMFTTQRTYEVWNDQGILFLKGTLLWLSKYSEKGENKKIKDKKAAKTLWKLPINELDSHLVDEKIKNFQEFVHQKTPTTFWEKISADHLAHTLDIPAFIIGGWYDPYLKGTIEDFERMQNALNNARRSHLRIGPWGHNPSQKFKGVDFGKQGNFNDQLVESLLWCDHWMKEEKPYEGKKVQFFVMGKNKWQESEVWPPKNISYQKFYLSKSDADLILSKKPKELQQTFSFTYDPKDPVLFCGKHLLQKIIGWIGPFEQKEITKDQNVLTYHSEPFTEEFTIAGPIKLVLFVASSAIDTDFCAKLCDQRTTGESYNLQTGFLRMRYRNSLKEPSFIQPGEIYRIEISLRAVANTFLKGHRMQLQITSSDFPTHARNLNTGECCITGSQMQTATQTIYAGGNFDSHIILPVLTK